MYLTTLYKNKGINFSDADEKNLKNAINGTWKEVYHQLGRNHKYPLNDDDFLRAHWIMYFKYDRTKKKSYAESLLGRHFSIKRFHKKVGRKVTLEEEPEEQRIDDFEGEDVENETTETEETSIESLGELSPDKIKKYVDSLKDSAVHWFNLHYPDDADDLSQAEKDALNGLKRIGRGYFRPLIMSLLKNGKGDITKEVNLLNHLERFIFIVFRLCRANANYCETKFCNAARELDEKTLSLEDVWKKLDEEASDFFDKDNTLKSENFQDYLRRKFKEGKKEGFYKWNGLHYFLYEYELELKKDAGYKRELSWEDFLKTPKDKVSIEHIFPQTPENNWKCFCDEIDEENRYLYNGSIGNLLLLSMVINSELQNHSFKNKVNRYQEGSHSEIEIVKNYEKWTPATIKKRGLAMLTFMENQWNFKFKDDKTKEDILFLNTEGDE